MKLLADMHISPATVRALRAAGFDVVRVDEVLSPSASDKEIVELGAAQGRTVLTQDLDFSAIVAISGRRSPSVISLRLSSSRVAIVNAVLLGILPLLEAAAEAGAIISVEDDRYRIRDLPVS